MFVQGTLKCRGSARKHGNMTLSFNMKSCNQGKDE